MTPYAMMAGEAEGMEELGAFTRDTLRCLHEGCCHATPRAFVMWRPFSDGIHIIAAAGEIHEIVAMVQHYGTGQFVTFRRGLRLRNGILPPLRRSMEDCEISLYPRERFCRLLLRVAGPRISSNQHSDGLRNQCGSARSAQPVPGNQ